MFSPRKEQDKKPTLTRYSRRQPTMESEVRPTQRQSVHRARNIPSRHEHPVLNDVGNHIQLEHCITESQKKQEPQQRVFKNKLGLNVQNNTGEKNRSPDLQERFSLVKTETSVGSQDVKCRNSLSKLPKQETVARCFRSNKALFNISKGLWKDNEAQNMTAKSNDRNTRNFINNKNQNDNYVVHRIMEYDCGFYLIFWFDWNLTSCTWHIRKDLLKSPLALKQFRIKEEGLSAVLKDLKRNKQMYPGVVFKRKKLPWWNEDKWLKNEQLKQEIEKSPHLFGYWMYKRFEVEWMSVLDPFADFKVAPLYLECFHEEQTLGFPKSFRFSIENILTKAAAGLIVNNKKGVCPNGCLCRADMCAVCQAVLGKKKLTICALHNKGRIVLGLRPKELGVRCAIFLCSDYCGCPENQKQLLPKFVRTDPLLVFRDPHKGWCLRALTCIPKGRIVSEYIGMVSTSKEASIDNSYQYDFADDLVVDSQFIGNESRFFSHCCQPNVVVVCAYSSPRGEGFYRLVFVTLRDIKKGEELCLDYHPDWPTADPNDTRIPKEKPTLIKECRCGAVFCRRWL